MLIFIDSNILCSNFRMKGPSFEVAQRVGTIVLGQIVVDEVCNKFKENLVDQVSKVKNAIRDLNKLLPESAINLDEIEVEEKCNEYKDFLDETLLVNSEQFDYYEPLYSFCDNYTIRVKIPYDQGREEFINYRREHTEYLDRIKQIEVTKRLCVDAAKNELKQKVKM